MELLRVTDEDIRLREADIDAMKHEIDGVSERLSLLENKYRDTIYLNEGARDRMGGMHRMHIKLLATR